MSSVVFIGSKLLKAGVRYGNMKLVTIRTAQVRGHGTPCNGTWYGIGQGFQGPSGTAPQKIYRVRPPGFFTKISGNLIFEALEGVPTKTRVPKKRDNYGN